jgi:feruloyl esterase
MNSQMKLIITALLSTMLWLLLSENSVAMDNVGCTQLKSQKITDTEITAAESVAEDVFSPSDQSGAPKEIFKKLPAFCRIVGVIRPRAESEIGFEIWLPEQWNGRYLQVGNGGFAGSINYGGLVPGLRNGFAVASTDDGHKGEGATWALGHPESLVDYGYRAVHLTSSVAREIISTYYGRNLSYAYFSGCSDGGRESLMEAQRYPEDFNGWVVGAPGNDLTGIMAYLLSLSQIEAALQEPLTTSQLEALTKAALARCDRADGVADGVIDDPLRCPFDPAELLCREARDGRCLSKSQVDAVRRIYDDARDPRTHASLAPGFRTAFGDEVRQWPLWVGSVGKDGNLTASLSQMFSEAFWPFMVYNDPKLDFRRLDIVQAASDARSRVGMILNAVDPDLSVVRASGKKIIQYHGWADAVVPAQYSIGYYEAVEKYLRRDNRDFYRLFMAPGMEHCGGGPGANSFSTPFDPRPFGAGYDLLHEFDPERNVLAALVRWVEKGQAPEKIVATKYRDDDGEHVIRTRPLCPYPSIARWTGKGSTDDAHNFVCRGGVGSHDQDNFGQRR